jgi:cytidylate kinase
MSVIAMTREIGSRGAEVAAGVATRLGLKIIRSETVADSVAERLGIEPSAFMRHMNGEASLIERWQIDRAKVLHYTAEEILRLAQQSDALIKGWGAATLLRDLPQIISVRVCAPMDFRVRVLMGRLGSTDVRAVREEIERQDAVRVRTMMAYFNVEQEDARLYHLVLNTERLPVDACVRLITDLAASPRFRGIAAVRSALADKLLEAKIGSAFAEHVSPTMATPRIGPLRKDRFRQTPHQHADPPHAVALLGVRRERPRSRAAEERDEVAAFRSPRRRGRAASAGR